jgi:hypothetical protein
MRRLASYEPAWPHAHVRGLTVLVVSKPDVELGIQARTRYNAASLMPATARQTEHRLRVFFNKVVST